MKTCSSRSRDSPPDECGSSVRFTTNADGTPIMLMGFAYAEAAALWPAQVCYLALSLTAVLLSLAPLWAAGVLAYSALTRRRIVPPSLVLWPAIAGMSFVATPRLLATAFHAGVIGIVHPLTIAICALTIVFALASTASLVQAMRWSLRPDRPRLRWRLVTTTCGVAFFGLTLWLAANGWIGMRTWSW